MVMFITSIGTASAGINEIVMKASMSAQHCSMMSSHQMMADSQNTEVEPTQHTACNMDEQAECCSSPCECSSQAFTSYLAVITPEEFIQPPLNANSHYIYVAGHFNTFQTSLDRPPIIV